MKKIFSFGLLGVLCSLGVVLAATFTTSWNNADLPSGNGDYELVTNPCGTGNTLVAVETKVSTSSSTFIFTGSSYFGILFGRYVHVYGPLYPISQERGIFCINAENPGNLCLDYQVRFICSVAQAPNSIRNQPLITLPIDSQPIPILQTGINLTGINLTGINLTGLNQTGTLFIRSTDTGSFVNVSRGSIGALLQQFSLLASGIQINVLNISILYSGALFSNLPNFSNMKAYYYNSMGSLMSIQSCTYAAHIYTCPSFIGLTPGIPVLVKLRADIPYYASGVASLTVYAVSAINQRGTPQQAIGLVVPSLPIVTLP